MVSPRSWTRAVRRTRVKQRRSRGKPGTATVSPPEGYPGVNSVQRQRQNESDQTLGNSPRSWRRVHWYHAYPWTQTTTLSISCSTLSLRDPSCYKLNPATHAFLSFFSRCTISFVPRAPFMKLIFAWLNITKKSFFTSFIRNLTLTITFKSNNNEDL